MKKELYEKLGLFYLGQQLDTNQEPNGLLELLKSDALTTHTAIIGMTGSGKTGLGIGLLEEAAIDNIPALIIDPKGDMGNLLLAFEELSPQEFEPWIDPFEAKKKGLSTKELAKKTAELWQKGLESFDQDKERIKRYKKSVDHTIFTPKSSAGVPISLLADFKAPPKNLDADSYTQLLSATVSSLLSLVDVDDKRAFVFLSNLLDHFWKEHTSPTLEELIAAIIAPPFKQIGVLTLEHFFNQKDRMDLALVFNTLLADPSFSLWMQGEPLNISHLLYTTEGKPRHSIFYIAHLNDKERMFFVTRLLSELISWMRTQSGTSALRALLYMDEIFGYFPPNANPPSKEPMLLLLKQARAYGLGVILSTQNPVDLDYKGLANIGTWFLGRLQTKQDIDRVIDGLLKASGSLEKDEIKQLLSNLNKRVFLLRSVHKEQLELFQTRWVLSYLKGPLSKDEIQKLMANKKEIGSSPTENIQPVVKKKRTQKPLLSSKIMQRYEITDPTVTPLFHPYLYFEAKLHYYSVSRGVDKVVQRCESIDASEAINFTELFEEECKLFHTQAPTQAQFTTVCTELLGADDLKKYEKAYKEYLYNTQRLVLYKVKKLRLTSNQEESYEEFVERVYEVLREKKAQEIAKLQERYAKKLDRLHNKLERLYYKLQQEKEQAKSKTTDSILSIGIALLDSFFGTKRIKKSTLSKASSAISKAKRAYNEYDDIKFVENQIEELKADIAALEEELGEKVDLIEKKYALENFEIEELPIRPKKSEIEVKTYLLWRQL